MVGLSAPAWHSLSYFIPALLARLPRRQKCFVVRFLCRQFENEANAKFHYDTTGQETEIFVFVMCPPLRQV